MLGDIQVVDYTGKVLTEEDVTQCVAELRRLLLDDELLSRIPSYDEYLLRFLHCTSFDVPSALKRMQQFHKLVLENPNWFLASSPSDMKERIQDNVKAMLPDKDKHGYSVYICKLGRVDANKTTLKEQAHLDEIWFETIMDDPVTQATGINVIFDISGYSWKPLKWLTPSNIVFVTKAIDLYPCRDIIYHIVNTSSLLKIIIKIVWPFLNVNIKKNVKFHFDNWASLHEYVSSDILPAEYGGTGPELDIGKLGEWLLEQDSQLKRKFDYRKALSNNLSSENHF